MIKNSKILIVDDDPFTCGSLKTLLSSQSYDIQTCCSGNEALKYLTKDEFDLVVMDIFMKGMDGFQVIENIVDKKIDTPVIIMTGNTSTETAVKALRIGASDYLKKPFKSEELFSSVRNLLEQRMLKKENQLIISELKKSQNQYKTLFNSSTDAISIINADTGLFIDCNNAAVELHQTGSRENLIGMSLGQLSPEFQPNGELSHELSLEYIQDAFKKGAKVFEWTHCKNDGTPFPVIVTLSAMKLDEQNLVMAIGRDITHRKQAEKEREALIKELQESLEKVKTLSGLVPICSHCKKIRDDKGYWNQIESYIQKHSEATFSHGICPECSDKIYGDEDWYIKMKKKNP
jgi:PAS domain S-box-containing protein